jgi:calcium-dependent protein kinase
MGCVKSKPISPSVVDSKNESASLQIPGVCNVVVEDYEESNQTSRTVLSELMDTLHNTPIYKRGNNCVDVVTADIATIETIYCGVKDGPILGYGITGVVRKCTHKKTGAEFALKTLSLKQIETALGLEQLKEELGILMQLDHPNIVKLEAVYESEDEIFLIQELLNGGDLFDHLDSQPEEHYSEAQCARLVKQMLSAVRYIHSKGIIHRDLKLENFLFAGPEGELKMIDFGLSKHFNDGSKHHEPVGTRYTVAPEILLGNYNEKVDVSTV